MNLQELGAVFKQERERRGLSVEDVVQRTKISRRNVLAIESGRKEDLPHPVYAKGFVKNYAKLLNLDPEQFAAALSAEYFVAEDDFGNDPTKDKPISMTASRNVGSQGRRSGMRWGILFLLALVLAGVAIWITLISPRLREATQVPPAPAPQAAPAPPAEPAPPASDAPALGQPPAESVYVPPADLPQNDAAEAKPAATPDKAPASPATPAKPGTETAPAKPGLAPAAPAVPAKPSAEATPAKPATPPASTAPTTPAKPATDANPAVGSRLLEIRASQLCWVNAEVDGATVLDMLLQPGEAKAIHFDKALTVKFGNAGGVKVSLDNKPFPLNAQSGEVRTVTIP